MAPLVSRMKNVIVPPTGATAGGADSTPPRLCQAPVNVGNLYTTTVQLPTASQDLGGGLLVGGILGGGLLAANKIAQKEEGEAPKGGTTGTSGKE